MKWRQISNGQGKAPDRIMDIGHWRLHDEHKCRLIQRAFGFNIAIVVRIYYRPKQMNRYGFEFYAAECREFAANSWPEYSEMTELPKKSIRWLSAYTKKSFTESSFFRMGFDLYQAIVHNKKDKSGYTGTAEFNSSVSNELTSLFRAVAEHYEYNRIYQGVTGSSLNFFSLHDLQASRRVENVRRD